MKRRFAIFWSWHKGKVIACAVYYVLFLLFSLYAGVWRGWSLRLPMLLLLLVLLLVGIGGGENHFSRYKAARRDPVTAQDQPKPRWDLESIPFLGVLCLILPPGLYLLLDLLVRR